jgi:hypothetical protein
LNVEAQGPVPDGGGGGVGGGEGHHLAVNAEEATAAGGCPAGGAGSGWGRRSEMKWRESMRARGDTWRWLGFGCADLVRVDG